MSHAPDHLSISAAVLQPAHDVAQQLPSQVQRHVSRQRSQQPQRVQRRTLRVQNPARRRIVRLLTDGSSSNAVQRSSSTVLVTRHDLRLAPC